MEKFQFSFFLLNHPKQLANRDDYFSADARLPCCSEDTVKTWSDESDLSPVFMLNALTTVVVTVSLLILLKPNIGKQQ